MELTEVVRKLFGRKPFTAAMFLDRATDEDLPVMVRFADANGGSPVRAMGHALKRTPGVKSVGVREHATVWQLDES